MVLVWLRNRFWNLVVAVICCEVVRAVLFSCGGGPIHPFVNPPAENGSRPGNLDGLNWSIAARLGCIAKSLRNAGYRHQREVQEKTHDIVVKLLTGTLFRGYDVGGGDDGEAYLLKRFARVVGNGIKNLV